MKKIPDAYSEVGLSFYVLHNFAWVIHARTRTVIHGHESTSNTSLWKEKEATDDRERREGRGGAAGGTATAHQGSRGRGPPCLEESPSSRSLMALGALRQVSSAWSTLADGT